MKTRDAFAFRKLYDTFATSFIDKKTGEEIILLPDITTTDYSILSYFFGDDYSETPLTFEETRNRVNLTVENFKYVERNIRRLDRHIKRLLKRIDIESGNAEKDKQAGLLFDKYLRIEDFFLSIEDTLRKFWKADLTQLKSLYQKSNGDRLRKVRFSKGYTQAELAKMLGIPMATYASYERGDRDIPTFMFYRLSKILDVSADEILGIPAK